MSARTHRPTARSLVSSAVRWLDDYSLWAMNPSMPPAHRDERRARGWSGPEDQRVVVRELVR